MQVAWRAGGVAGAADVTDDVARVDLVSLREGRGLHHVRIEVLAPLAEPADDDEVSVAPGIEGALDHRPRPHRSQRRPAAGGDVEALVDATAVASGAELADGTAGAVRPADREEVAEEGELSDLLGVPAGGPDQNAVGALRSGIPAFVRPSQVSICSLPDGTSASSIRRTSRPSPTIRIETSAGAAAGEPERDPDPTAGAEEGLPRRHRRLLDAEVGSLDAAEARPASDCDRTSGTATSEWREDARC